MRKKSFNRTRRELLKAFAGFVPLLACGNVFAVNSQNGITSNIARNGINERYVIPNNIGLQGGQGFGVGICPAMPYGFSEMYRTNEPDSDNYGNYQYSDGSVMCWTPAFYYKWGTGANGLPINYVDVQPYSALGSPAAAALKGYALHRMFYDAGVVQPGVFVDKYIASNNGGIASSLPNAAVLTSAQRGSLATATFASLTGAPANAYYGALAAAKTRGADFFCNSRFIFAGLAMLSYAHAQASTSTTYCGWYDATYNTPKGNNNNALGDDRDAAILYVNDGNGTYPTGKTGSANLFNRTTHNGQNCGVADMNGVIWEITPGLTSDGTNYYILKPSVAMKDITGGNTLATDLWGATGLAALYDSLGATYGALWATGADRVTAFGAAAQVFSEATSGNAWNFTSLGGPLAAGIGGTNAFGGDILYDFKPNEMCPLSGAAWATGSGAGVWALYLNAVRTDSYNYVGLRAALYL